LTGAYQQTSNFPKLVDTVNRLLQTNPNNLVGLAMMAAIDRQDRTAQSQNKVMEAGQFGERGLQALAFATKPGGTSDLDWEKRKEMLATVFNGAIGYAALQAQEFPKAQKYLKLAVQAAPDNLENTYSLGLAELQANPINAEGFGTWRVQHTWPHRLYGSRSRSGEQPNTFGITEALKDGTGSCPKPAGSRFCRRALPSAAPRQPPLQCNIPRSRVRRALLGPEHFRSRLNQAPHRSTSMTASKE
jgi:hypothetical protein